MATKIEKLENNIVKIYVTVDTEVAKKAYNSAVSRAAKQINIPGFRKGKAPFNVIEKYVGEARLKEQVVDDVLPLELSKAVSENELDLALEPAIESFKFSVGEPLEVVVSAELKPEVVLGQ